MQTRTNGIHSKRDGIGTFSNIDQKIRSCIQSMWMALPDDSSVDDLETQLNRMATRDGLMTLEKISMNFPELKMEPILVDGRKYLLKNFDALWGISEGAERWQN